MKSNHFETEVKYHQLKYLQSIVYQASANRSQSIWYIFDNCTAWGQLF